jgi:tRNA (cmo5U34)-methyltransferase
VNPIGRRAPTGQTGPVAAPQNRWPDVDHALAYLRKADEIPHRAEGTAAFVELLPDRVERVLDLGTGDGRLLDLVLTARPGASGVGLDLNAEMLARARERFAEDDRVTIAEHDLDDRLPGEDTFDLIVSSFAIHHVADDRKRSLYGECFDRLCSGGTFLNLEHVASPTEALHEAFLAELDIVPADDDPSNLLAPVDDQLQWLRAAGFTDVDCHWKWRELALLAGVRPR